MAISAVVSAADFSVTSDRKSTEETLTDNFINNITSHWYKIRYFRNVSGLKEPDVDSMLGSGKTCSKNSFLISNFLNFDHNFNVFLSLATLECRLVLKRVSQNLSNVITLTRCRPPLMKISALEIANSVVRELCVLKCLHYQNVEIQRCIKFVNRFVARKTR